MKKHFFKKAAVIAVAVATLAIVPTASGCLVTNGRDGVNGKDLTIYDIWQETKTQTGNSELTYDEFLREYLSFTSPDLQEATSLQASINRSLLSGVSIISTFDEYKRVFGFGGTQTVAEEAQYYGSGVILDVNRQSGDMFVVTNCHVVYSLNARTSSNSIKLDKSSGFAKRVDLWLYGSEFEEENAIKAEIIGASKSYDIAVLKVSGSDLVKRSQAVAAQWSGGEERFIGETVYAVGNADGKKLSASVGYVSKDSEEITVNLGTDSNLENYEYRVLRTDTAINGGNSGGGLFNKYGELVGIVNAKTVSESIDNMGYALPASTTKRVVQKLIAQTGGNFGLESVPQGITYEVEDSYTTGLNADGNAEIKEVVTVKNANSGTVWGKLKANDVIKRVTISRNNTVIEDISVNRLHNITDALIVVQANDKVTFTIERDGEETKVEIVFTSSDFVRKK